ncbi:MAG: ParB/Srx family N-terminal domain-containing protein [Bacteriovoracaceae bacterium]
MKTLLVIVLSLFCQFAHAKGKDVRFYCLVKIFKNLRQIPPSVSDMVPIKVHRQQLGKVFDEVHPTQHVIGIPRIIVFKNEILKSDQDGILEILADKPIPYILGPDGKKWILDRHHTLYTLQKIYPKLQKRKDLDVSKFQMTYKMLGDYSDLSQDEFIEKMKSRKFIYPVKQNSETDYHNLPKKLKKLDFDFYRGLAWLVRKSKAIKKVQIPYFEFIWAQALKKKFQYEEFEFNETNVREAIRYAMSDTDGQDKLPGWRPFKTKKTEDKYFSKLDEILELLKEAGYYNP